MKLIIQIPCWNEEKTIAHMLASLPRSIDGVDTIETLVIDDGSTDNSILEALRANVTKIIKLPGHKGLATAFTAGVEAAIAMGGDILVNTDADMQYPSEFIKPLITPILNGTADMTIGNRLDNNPPPFSPFKMFLQRTGTAIVRLFSGTKVEDAASGFRAFNRTVMKSIIIHDQFSYTMESIFLASVNRFRIINVPIMVNATTRSSRLFKTIGQYIRRSTVTILRIYMMYHPLRFFLSIGIFFLLGAFALGIRYLLFMMAGHGNGNIQSLILLVVLAVIGVQSVIVALLADIVAANRRLLEDIRSRQMEVSNE